MFSISFLCFRAMAHGAGPQIESSFTLRVWMLIQNMFSIKGVVRHEILAGFLRNESEMYGFLYAGFVHGACGLMLGLYAGAWIE
jgi:hypothetical protein